MKKIIVIILTFFIYISSYSQTKNDDYKKMLDTAILIHTTSPDKVPYKTGIYLIDVNHQAYFPASDELQKKFNYINVYDKKNVSILKKGINAWKVLALLNGNRLTVNIIDFNIKYERNNYKFSNRGGATVIFQYYCGSGKWELKETKWFGI